MPAGLARKGALLACLVAQATVASFGAPAHAQTQTQTQTQTPTDVEPFRVKEAEDRFHQGEQLFDHKEIAAACTAFADSYALDAQLGTLLNLAFCHEALSKTATALREYELAAAWATERGQEQRRQFATDRAAAVARRLSSVHLELPADVRGYAIEIDGEALPRERWGAPVFLDPGAHAMRVTAPAHQSQELSLRVGEGPSSQDVTVPALAVQEDSDASSPCPRCERHPVRVAVGWIASTAGVVGLAGGGYLTARALGGAQDATPAAVVALSAGSIALGGGIWMLLSSRSHDAQQTATSSASSAIGLLASPLPGGAMGGVGGTF